MIYIYMVYKDIFMVGSFELSVWEYVPYWSMRAACYAFVVGTTSRSLYSVILVGIGSCVPHLLGGSHLQSLNSIEVWELRATPLCGSHLQNSYPGMLALWGCIIVHICLWGVSMVLWDDGLWGRLLVCQSYGYFSLVIHG